MKVLLSGLIGLTKLLNLLADHLILSVVRLHTAGLIDLLVGQDTIAQIGISDGTEIVPLACPLTGSHGI